MTTKTNTKRANLRPLLVDVAVPVGGYYLLKNGFGMSTPAALGWSSVVPALRTVFGVVRERKVNAFAALILFVNVVSLVLSFVSGDPRLMLAKDSGISSAIGIGILVSVALGRPMMTAAMKPWLVKGDAEREAAWARLAAGSAAFRRAEKIFSLVWGTVLLVECVVRIVGAYTVPVDTMVWLGTVILAVAMLLGFLVSGALAAGPMAHMLIAETKSARGANQDDPAPVPALAMAGAAGE
ncbi:VC0807 family protein [Streptomyces sp. Li-HN-5-11]|uniref:VC0807 family protein n=1 Tax=Streptomyces sp. Li-HN-5-11 TaxID=3075432 RepID=UPI0028AD6003|nr:VC0807 family protein [Streptomyces sp. Li-HN-5-11]WNM29368.1 VC0807 family protein [Streptomyces sp. Li-HN-5-11]